MDSVQTIIAGVHEGEPDLELDALEARYGSGQTKGWTHDDGDRPPFDLRVARPRVVSLAKLCELAHVAPPPQLDPGEPKLDFVLVHSMTPFHHPGASSGGVWGLGYEVEILDTTADTLAAEPGTAFRTIGKVGQRVHIGLTAGGALSQGPVPGLASPLPIGIPHASFHASTEQSFALAIELAIRVLKVQAGPFGNGGCKWNLYRQEDPLDATQILLQTIRVAGEVTAAKVRIKTWAAKSRLGFRRKTWEYEPVEFELRLV